MDIDAIHKALANPVRRQILQWLKEPQQHFIEQEHPLEMGVCCKLIDQNRPVAIDGVGAPGHPAARRAREYAPRRPMDLLPTERGSDPILPRTTERRTLGIPE